MRVIHDSDVVEFVDDSGDKLILLRAPRQRDVISCDLMARDEAVAELDKLKASGIDTDKILADAQADPDALEKAQESARNSTSPAVREARYKSLAVRASIGTESFDGHQQMLEAYRDMDPESAAWADAQVASVWNAAIPSDADTRGPRADVAVPQDAAVSATD